MRSILFSVAVLSLLQTPSAAPTELLPRQSSSTRNDLQNGACKPFSLIFARGTTEGGNLGSVVGPPLVTTLGKVLPGGTNALAVQGVNYPANVAGFSAGGDAAGSRDMAALAAGACSTTKIILAGYSQGAQLVHNAIALMSQATANKIGAVVMFGDPDNGDALGKGLDAKSKTFCNSGDLICRGQSIILFPHLTYGSDASAAASFVASKFA
ncbi:hypothetical protein H072_4336 [Dactylellina haptotyla CBS 200.50]|uniref:cutinase n=1 Tax=Dactylellina haptotyla (strain CBS 200.50) TaxID=1284197 RepID=S8BQL5_DACHA|nr:hypothetical protein H072_4336 [Dactylellina haptotyla CBS 200.50]